MAMTQVKPSRRIDRSGADGSPLVCAAGIDWVFQTLPKEGLHKSLPVIANEVKQSKTFVNQRPIDCHVATLLAMTGFRRPSLSLLHIGSSWRQAEKRCRHQVVDKSRSGVHCPAS